MREGYKLVGVVMKVDVYKMLKAMAGFEKKLIGDIVEEMVEARYSYSSFRKSVMEGRQSQIR